MALYWTTLRVTVLSSTSPWWLMTPGLNCTCERRACGVQAHPPLPPTHLSAREAGIIGPSQTSLTVTVSSALPPSLLAFARIATLAVGVDEAVPGAATRHWALAAVNGPVSLRNEFDAIRELAASLAALQERQRGVIESVLGKGRRVEHGKARRCDAYAAGTCTHTRRPPPQVTTMHATWWRLWRL